jgi:hypothetical protein
MSHLIDVEPPCLREATEEKVWKDAIIEEYQYISKIDVQNIIQGLEGKSVVTSKWIYKIKHAANEYVEKYKTRSIARGFSQKEGVFYDETLYPVILIHFLPYYHP